MADAIQNIGHIYGDCGSYNRSPATDVQETSPVRSLPEDRVTLSKEARNSSSGVKNESELNEEEKQQVNQLKKRDAEVKAHEQAHMAAGGGIVQSGATYQYENGPDGKQYAVGGEVKIDLSPENTPDATIRKMQQVRRAALAPAQPSGTDRSVAAQASQIEAQARMERSTQDKDSATESTQVSDPEATQPKTGNHPGTSQSNPLMQAFSPGLSETKGQQVNLSI